jgi:hypothetical protein
MKTLIIITANVKLIPYTYMSLTVLCRWRNKNNIILL